jgi:hypothetical protein
VITKFEDACSILGIDPNGPLTEDERVVLKDLLAVDRQERLHRKSQAHEGMIYKSQAGPLTEAVEAISKSPRLSRQAKAIMLADLAEDAEAMLERHENAQTFELWDNHPAWRATPRIRSLARKSLGLDPDEVSDQAVDYLVGKALRQVGAMSVRDLARRSSGLGAPIPGTWGTGYR